MKPTENKIVKNSDLCDNDFIPRRRNMMHELRKIGPNQFSACSYEIALKNEKIERMVVEQVDEVSIEGAADFLETNGVDADEIDVALMEMEKNEHNAASFGLMGGLVCTLFIGSVQ